MKQCFEGFPAEANRYLRRLQENNDRAWFEANRDQYDRYILDPARLWVQCMAERLREVAPHLVADPRVDRSIFRVHRDTRFSKDKRPYKTYLGVFMWEGQRPKMECPGFYFQLEADAVTLGAGINQIPAELLPRYRDAVVSHEQELREILNELNRNEMGVTGESYKRVPAGYPADHPLAELLKKKSLFAHYKVPTPPELHTPDFIDWCYARFYALAPLHRWLVNTLEEA